MTPFDAVVLAGGAGRRLGGPDKPGQLVGGRSLLDRVLDAVAAAEQTVVVGPERPTARPVSWVREEPPGGGPVAGLAAGLSRVRAPVTVLLAGDLPFLTPSIVALLLDSAGKGNGALLVDEGGRDQLLVGAWRTQALREAVPADPAGGRLSDVLTGLAPYRLSLSAPAEPAPWFDCDTAQDLARARAIAGAGA